MSGLVRGPSNCLGAFFFAFVWQVVAAVFHGLTRAYVMVLELATGVVNWPAYATSWLKVLGVMTGMVAFLGMIALCLQLLAAGVSTRIEVPLAAFGLQLGMIIVLLFVTRFCFRRMI